MTRFSTLVRKHQLSIFFTLALGLTAGTFLPFYWAGGEAIPWFTFGPLVAALFVAMAAGGWPAVKEILASMFRWRAGWGWYAIAVGFPIGVQFVSILINPLFGSPAPAWENIPPLAQIMPWVAIYAVFSGPLGEEPGWRGFALPRLLAGHSALAASVILGLLWAAWHVPLALMGDLTWHGSINVLFAATVFTWLYQNTRGSVLLAILMHVSHQNSVRYLGKVFVDGDYIQQQWIGVAMWGAAAAVILILYGTKRFRHHREADALATQIA